MTLIIGDKNKFSKIIKDEVVEIDNLCHFKDKIDKNKLYDVIVDRKYIEEGVFEKTTIFLDELLLTIPIQRLIYLPIKNRLLLTEIASMYDVCVEFNIF